MSVNNLNVDINNLNKTKREKDLGKVIEYLIDRNEVLQEQNSKLLKEISNRLSLIHEMNSSLEVHMDFEKEIDRLITEVICN